MAPKTGSGRVTIRTVADDAGVSTAAVSKVLRDAYGVSDALRARVRQSMEKLGYRPHAAARGMRGQTYTLGFIIPDLHNPLFADILAGKAGRPWKEQRQRIIQRFIWSRIDQPHPRCQTRWRNRSRHCFEDESSLWPAQPDNGNRAGCCASREGVDRVDGHGRPPKAFTERGASPRLCRAGFCFVLESIARSRQRKRPGCWHRAHST